MQPASVLEIDDELSVLACGTPALTPAQESVAEDLFSSLAVAEVSVLRVAPGMGRTVVMRAVHSETDGAFVVAHHLLRSVGKNAREALEKAFLRLLSDTLCSSQIVFVDDLHLLGHYLTDAVTGLLDEASRIGRKLVFSVNGKNAPDFIGQRAIVWEMGDFEPDDYVCIAKHYLGSAAACLDMVQVHRFAPALTAYQVRDACLWLGLRYATPDTPSLIQYLRSRFPG